MLERDVLWHLSDKKPSAGLETTEACQAGTHLGCVVRRHDIVLLE